MVAATTTIASACDSPIERQFLHAWNRARLGCTKYLMNLDEGIGEIPPPKEWCKEWMVFEMPLTKDHIMTQRRVGAYRVDFMICHVDPDGKDHRVIVECDGHDFHERTKEQAAHDRKRDRYLAANGFVVMRFTGSEIFNDADACVAEVIAYLEKP